MASKYWKSMRAELALPTDPAFWDEFVVRTSARTARGTSLWRLLRNVRPTTWQQAEALAPSLELEEEPTPEEELEVIEVANLILDPRTPKSVGDLRSSIEDANPPIPQILVFDKTMMTHRVEGGTHAVLLLQIDFDREKLYVVDPTLFRRMEAAIYDFGDFRRGWATFSNLNILVYPKGIKITSGSDRSLWSYLRGEKT